MIAWGAVRAAGSWLVGGYLVALATVIVPALALTRLVDPAPATVWSGVAALLAAGPVAGFVAAWGTTRGVVAAALAAGATPAPDEVVDAVARACAARHVRPPVCWVSERLGPDDRPVVVRGLGTGHAFLPAAGSEQPAAAVARTVAGGSAAALLTVLAVSRWLRVWQDALRLTVSPTTTLRRRRPGDQAAIGALAVQVVVLPFVLGAAVGVVPAWLATRVALLLVAPTRTRTTAALFGTGRGRPRVVQELAAPEEFAAVTVAWATQGALSRTRPAPGPAADGGTTTTPRGGCQRPLQLAAGFAALPVASLALALVFLAPAVGFVGEAFTAPHVLPGEQGLAAVVTAVDPGPDRALLADVAESTRVEFAVPGTELTAGFATSRDPAVGDPATLARADDGAGSLRWTGQRSGLRLAATAVLPVLVSWLVFAGLTAAGAGGLAGALRGVRAAQEERTASRGGTDPTAAAAVRARWDRREVDADIRRAWLGWAAVAFVPASFVGWLGEVVGRGLSGLFRAGDAGGPVDFLVGFGLAYGGLLVVARLALRRGHTVAAPARHAKEPAT